MLKEIHSYFGTYGTLILAVVGLVSAMAWLMAVTGIVLRDIPRPLKIVLVPLVSAVPPLAIFLMGWFTYRDKRRDRLRRRAQMLNESSITGLSDRDS